MNLNQLSIALLIKESKTAQKISDVIRLIHVYPYYYDNLKDFWEASLKETFSLSIIDVELMSDQTLNLAQHPGIADQSLSLAFYTTQQNTPLTLSTYNFFHFGIIHDLANVELQLKSILQRVNHHRLQLHENHKLRRNLASQQKKYDLLAESSQTLQTKLLAKQAQDQTIKKLSELSLGDDLENPPSFSSLLANWLDQVDQLAHFTAFAFNLQSSTIHQLEIESPKVKKLTNWSFPQQLPRGITSEIQNFLFNTTLKVLGPQTLPIRIFGQKNNPEILIFAEFTQVYWEAHHLALVEQQLSHLFTKTQSIVRDQQDDIRPLMLSFGELFSLIQSKTCGSLLSIDFINLFFASLEINKFSFQWREFYQDLTAIIKNSLNEEFYLSHYDSKVFVLVPQGLTIEQIHQLKTTVGQLNFLYYFNSSHLIGSKELKVLPIVEHHALVDYISFLKVVTKTSTLKRGGQSLAGHVEY